MTMAWPAKVSIVLLSCVLLMGTQAATPIQNEAAASRTQTKHEGDSAIEVPLEIGCGKAVFIHGTVEHTPALTFMVDSGGGSSYILDLARARSFGLEPYRRF